MSPPWSWEAWDVVKSWTNEGGPVHQQCENCSVFAGLFETLLRKLKQNSFYLLCIHSAIVGGIPRSPTLPWEQNRAWCSFCQEPNGHFIWEKFAESESVWSKWPPKEVKFRLVKADLRRIGPNPGARSSHFQSEERATRWAKHGTAEDLGPDDFRDVPRHPHTCQGDIPVPAVAAADLRICGAACKGAGLGPNSFYVHFHPTHKESENKAPHGQEQSWVFWAQKSVLLCNLLCCIFKVKTRCYNSIPFHTVSDFAWLHKNATPSPATQITYHMYDERQSRSWNLRLHTEQVLATLKLTNRVHVGAFSWFFWVTKESIGDYIVKVYSKGQKRQKSYFSPAIQQLDENLAWYPRLSLIFTLGDHTGGVPCYKMAYVLSYSECIQMVYDGIVLPCLIVCVYAAWKSLKPIWSLNSIAEPGIIYWRCRW